MPRHAVGSICNDSASAAVGDDSLPPSQPSLPFSLEGRPAAVLTPPGTACRPRAPRRPREGRSSLPRPADWAPSPCLQGGSYLHCSRAVPPSSSPRLEGRGARLALRRREERPCLQGGGGRSGPAGRAEKRGAARPAGSPAWVEEDGAARPAGRRREDSEERPGRQDGGGRSGPAGWAEDSEGGAARPAGRRREERRRLGWQGGGRSCLESRVEEGSEASAGWAEDGGAVLPAGRRGAALPVGWRREERPGRQGRGRRTGSGPAGRGDDGGAARRPGSAASVAAGEGSPLPSLPRHYPRCPRFPLPRSRVTVTGVRSTGGGGGPGGEEDWLGTRRRAWTRCGRGGGAGGRSCCWPAELQQRLILRRRRLRPGPPRSRRHRRVRRLARGGGGGGEAGRAPWPAGGCCCSPTRSRAAGTPALASTLRWRGRPPRLKAQYKSDTDVQLWPASPDRISNGSSQPAEYDGHGQTRNRGS